MALSHGVVPNYRIALPHYWRGLADKSPREAREGAAFTAHMRESGAHPSPKKGEAGGAPPANSASETLPEKRTRVKERHPDLSAYMVDVVIYQEEQARRRDAEREKQRLGSVLAKRSDRHTAALLQAATAPTAIGLDGKPRTLSSDTRQWMRESAPKELGKWESLLSAAKDAERRERLANMPDPYEARKAKVAKKDKAAEEHRKQLQEDTAHDRQVRQRKQRERASKALASADTQLEERVNAVEAAADKHAEAIHERGLRREEHLQQRSQANHFDETARLDRVAREREEEDARKAREHQAVLARQEAAQRRADAHKRGIAQTLAKRREVPVAMAALSQQHVVDEGADSGSPAAAASSDPYATTHTDEHHPPQSRSAQDKKRAVTTPRSEPSSPLTKADIAVQKRIEAREKKLQDIGKRRDRHNAAAQLQEEIAAEERDKARKEHAKKEAKALKTVEEKDKERAEAAANTLKAAHSRVDQGVQKRHARFDTKAAAIRNRREIEFAMQRRRAQTVEARRLKRDAEIEAKSREKAERSPSPKREVTLTSWSPRAVTVSPGGDAASTDGSNAGSPSSSRPTTVPQPPRAARPTGVRTKEQQDKQLARERAAEENRHDAEIDRKKAATAREAHAAEVLQKATQVKAAAVIAPKDVLLKDWQERQAVKHRRHCTDLFALESTDRRVYATDERQHRNDMFREFKETRTAIGVADRQRRAEAARCGLSTPRSAPGTAPTKLVPAPPPATASTFEARRAAVEARKHEVLEAKRERTHKDLERIAERTAHADEERQHHNADRANTARAKTRDVSDKISKVAADFDAVEQKCTDRAERLKLADARREEVVRSQQEVRSARIMTQQSRALASSRQRAEWTADADKKSEDRRFRHANRFTLVKPSDERPSTSDWSL